jgi:predicted dinucleotide-binding enzyme
MKTTNIGILGSGDVGQALGHGFAALGNQVKIGSRDAKSEKLKAWVTKEGKNASQGSFSEVAKFGEILVLATLGQAAEAAIEAAGKESFKGKVVLDVTNPLKIDGGRPVGLERGFNDSGGEQIQRFLPDAKVVKVFNTVGNALMFKPEFKGGPADMFFCGNDEGAKKSVADIVTAFGWNPIDIGGMEGARLLEPMCWLWVMVGVRTGAWNHAFTLVRK